MNSLKIYLMQYLKRDQNKLTFKDFLLLKSLKPQLATFLLLLLEVWRKVRLVGRGIYIYFFSSGVNYVIKLHFSPNEEDTKHLLLPNWLKPSFNVCSLAHFPLAESRITPSEASCDTRFLFLFLPFPFLAPLHLCSPLCKSFCHNTHWLLWLVSPHV